MNEDYTPGDLEYIHELEVKLEEYIKLVREWYNNGKDFLQLNIKYKTVEEYNKLENDLSTIENKLKAIAERDINE